MFWQRFNKINAQCCYLSYSEVLKINAFLVAIKRRIYIQQAHNYIFDQRCGNHFKCFIIVLCYRVYVYLGKFLFFHMHSGRKQSYFLTDTLPSQLLLLRSKTGRNAINVFFNKERSQ